MSQKAMETKQLSPRLAGEWFGIPITTVYQHVAMKCTKLEMLSVQCLVNMDRKALYGLANCYLIQALELHHVCIILTVLTGFQ